jgi:hypothetical protein
MYTHTKYEGTAPKNKKRSAPDKIVLEQAEEFVVEHYVSL